LRNVNLNILKFLRSINNFYLSLSKIGLEVSYQLSVISYQFTEKTPHTLHPTPYTLHPTPHTPHPTFLSALVMIVIGFFNRINKNAPKKEAFFNLSWGLSKMCAELERGCWMGIQHLFIFNHRSPALSRPWE
jgi:hypothetical protein